MKTKTTRYDGLSYQDFNVIGAEDELETVIRGKTIDTIWGDINHGDDLLVIKFTDQSELILRYDWIYEWAIKDNNER